jgi:hypothetical protein
VIRLIKFFLVLVFIISSSSTSALDPALRVRYSFLVLTDDYGILNKKDMADYAKEMKYEKFTGKHNGLVYTPYTSRCEQW